MSEGNPPASGSRILCHVLWEDHCGSCCPAFPPPIKKHFFPCFPIGLHFCTPGPSIVHVCCNYITCWPQFVDLCDQMETCQPRQVSPSWFAGLQGAAYTFVHAQLQWCRKCNNACQLPLVLLQLLRLYDVPIARHSHHHTKGAWI